MWLLRSALPRRVLRRPHLRRFISQHPDGMPTDAEKQAILQALREQTKPFIFASTALLSVFTICSIYDAARRSDNDVRKRLQKEGLLEKHELACPMFHRDQELLECRTKEVKEIINNCPSTPSGWLRKQWYKLSEGQQVCAAIAGTYIAITAFRHLRRRRAGPEQFFLLSPFYNTQYYYRLFTAPFVHLGWTDTVVNSLTMAVLLGPTVYEYMRSSNRKQEQMQLKGVPIYEITPMWNFLAFWATSTIWSTFNQNLHMCKGGFNGKGGPIMLTSSMHPMLRSFAPTFAMLGYIIGTNPSSSWIWCTAFTAIDIFFISKSISLWAHSAHIASFAYGLLYAGVGTRLYDYFRERFMIDNVQRRVIESRKSKQLSQQADFSEEPFARIAR